MFQAQKGRRREFGSVNQLLAPLGCFSFFFFKRAIIHCKEKVRKKTINATVKMIV